MNAPTKTFAPIRQHREHPPAIVAALDQYDAATTSRQRHRALAALARARADHRADVGDPDLAAEAQRIIDQLAARWTAWRRDGEP